MNRHGTEQYVKGARADIVETQAPAPHKLFRRADERRSASQRNESWEGGFITSEGIHVRLFVRSNGRSVP